MKMIFILLSILLGLVLLYFAGPKFDKPVYNKNLPALNLNTGNVDAYVFNHEAGFNIKPDNEARIVWYNDSLKTKTPYCLLYLHGFSASWYEGNPTHINIANDLKANLFLSRLEAHGLEDPDAFMQMNPTDLYESAKEALVVAKALGDKVILMGTSTGGTLALKLAADFPDLVNGLILLSPNIEINNFAATFLAGHWGINIARWSAGGDKYRVLEPGLPIEEKYWYQKYRWEGTVYLQLLLQGTMKEEVFKKVKQPVFVAYYYRDEDHQDQVVKVSAILNMFEALGTKDELKQKMAFPNANTHVIANLELSGCSKDVENAILRFTQANFITH
ncbi:MAG: alpha/beta hydrolase [Prolixibacteraceae bacterium]